MRLSSSFPAGGNSDIVVRAVADRLSLALGQPVIVENRPGGAGGTVGAKAVANASPDGYTLLFTPAAPLVTAPLIYKNLGYDYGRSIEEVAGFLCRSGTVEEVRRKAEELGRCGKWGLRAPARCSTVPSGTNSASEGSRLKLTVVQRIRAGQGVEGR
jgi:hypothetical protein